MKVECFIAENSALLLIDHQVDTMPDFRDAVIATGRKNLIMAGVTTDVCLIFPAIDAAIEGFNA